VGDPGAPQRVQWYLQLTHRHFRTGGRSARENTSVLHTPELADATQPYSPDAGAGSGRIREGQQRLEISAGDLWRFQRRPDFRGNPHDDRPDHSSGSCGFSENLLLHTAGEAVRVELSAEIQPVRYKEQEEGGHREIVSVDQTAVCGADID